jgi:diguanylate cyclase (GGDEF)-like protein/PAS domain S-box-containing protein
MPKKPTCEELEQRIQELEQAESELKTSEEALREVEEKYRTLFESSRDAIMTLAPPTWMFTSGNPATVELFRVRNEAEFISLGPWQLSPERQPDDKPSDEKAKEMIETAMHNGSHFFEWTHCHSDGKPFSAEVLLTRMEHSGQVLLQATVRDITNRKQAEEQRDRFVLKLQDTLKRLETLSAISQTVNQSLNLEQVLNEAIDRIMELFKPHSAHIRLLDDQTQELVLAVQKGLAPEDLKKLTKRLKLENAISHTSIKSHSAVIIEDILTDPLTTGTQSFAEKIGCRTLVTIPLLAKDKILGHMSIRGREPSAFTAEEIQLFTSIGHQVGTAIENASLYQQTQLTVEELKRLSYLDGLTGVANRRHFDEVLGLEWRRMMRDAKPLSLIMCDIDFFKTYNDTYGHQGGDDSLRQVANTLNSVLGRPEDLVTRYGGEEFAVTLPGTDSQGTKFLAETMRSRVESLGIVHVSSQVSEVLTISLGVASTIPTRGSSPHELISAADQALYEAKKEGRNRVNLAE